MSNGNSLSNQTNAELTYLANLYGREIATGTDPEIVDLCKRLLADVRREQTRRAE